MSDRALARALEPPMATAAALNHLPAVVEVITFLGPVVRLEVAAQGRPS